MNQVPNLRGIFEGTAPLRASYPHACSVDRLLFLLESVMTLVLLILFDDRDSVARFNQRIRLLTRFDVLQSIASRNQKPFTIVAR